MSEAHLTGCSVCGKRWISDGEKIGVACPWCESSCVGMGKLSKSAYAALLAAGVPDIRAKDSH